MDITNYIELLRESNRNKENTLILQKCKYENPIKKNIIGIMFNGKIYTKIRYENMRRQEDTFEKCIKK